MDCHGSPQSDFKRVILAKELGMVFEWKNKISCKKRIASLCPMQDTACLGLVHGMTQRDVVGRDVGGGFMFGIACTPVAD